MFMDKKNKNFYRPLISLVIFLKWLSELFNFIDSQSRTELDGDERHFVYSMGNLPFREQQINR